MKSTAGVVAASILFVAELAFGAEHHVSPAGSASGDGTASNPWDLPTALGHPAAVQPGDTIWLGAGTYRGTFSSRLRGTEPMPIVVRARSGDRVTLDGGDSGGAAILSVGGAYTWFWGFEITSSDPDRTTDQTGSAPSDIRRGGGIITAQSNGEAVGVKFINLVVHDTAQGYGFWLQAQNAEIYGNLIYYNGWDAPDRGHGHAIYAQNDAGTKTLRDNIMFDQFSYGIHAYGSGNAYLRNFVIEGNVSFNNGRLAQINPGFTVNILVGGESGGAGNSPLTGIVVSENATYSADSGGLEGGNNVGYSAGCSGSARIENNYFAQGTALSLVNCTSAMVTGNTLIGSLNGLSSTSHPSNTFSTSKPSANKVIVRKNVYEPGRAQIAVYNWEGAASVAVDLSAAGLASGSDFFIYDAQNFFGPPVAEGKYDGSPVNVRMTGLSKQAPVGTTALPHSGPEFGAFVLLGTPGAGTGGAAGGAGSPTGGSGGGSSGAGAGGTSAGGSAGAGAVPGGGRAGSSSASPAAEEDGGCGCRTKNRSRSDLLGLFGAGAALAFGAARRRRRASH